MDDVFDCEVYERAIFAYGRKHQIGKLAEECAELCAAALHYNDGRCSLEDLASEIADVEVMIDQMRIIFTNKVIGDAKRGKIIRLGENLIYGKR